MPHQPPVAELRTAVDCEPAPGRGNPEAAQSGSSSGEPGGKHGWLVWGIWRAAGRRSSVWNLGGSQETRAPQAGRSRDSNPSIPQ